MEQDKLLRKIKKLLALSKSTNPHEAASALAMAQSAGYKQGKEVTLNHGVNGKETVKLGVKK